MKTKPFIFYYLCIYHPKHFGLWLQHHAGERRGGQGGMG